MHNGSGIRVYVCMKWSRDHACGVVLAGMARL